MGRWRAGGPDPFGECSCGMAQGIQEEIVDEGIKTEREIKEKYLVKCPQKPKVIVIYE